MERRSPVDSVRNKSHAFLLTLHSPPSPVGFGATLRCLCCGAGKAMLLQRHFGKETSAESRARPFACVDVAKSGLKHPALG